MKYKVYLARKVEIFEEVEAISAREAAELGASLLMNTMKNLNRGPHYDLTSLHVICENKVFEIDFKMTPIPYRVSEVFDSELDLEHAPEFLKDAKARRHARVQKYLRNAKTLTDN